MAVKASVCASVTALCVCVCGCYSSVCMGVTGVSGKMLKEASLLRFDQYLKRGIFRREFYDYCLGMFSIDR